MKKIMELIYCYGFKVGLALMISPIVKDLLWRGAREWNYVSIGSVGVLIQLVGLFLVINGGRDWK